MGNHAGWIRAQWASLAFSLSILVALVMAGGGLSWGEARAEFRRAFADRLPYLETSFGEQVRQEMQLPVDFVAVTSFPNAEELNAIWASLWILREGRFDLSDARAPIVPQLESAVVDAGPDGSLYLPFVLQNLVQLQRSPVEGRSDRRAYWDERTFLEAGFFTVPLVLQAATWVHEARHGEGVLQGIDPKGFLHSECLRGVSAGRDLCDVSLRAGGAYAAEFEYLARVANRGQNFHPVYQSLARIAAIEYAHSKFERPELRAKSTIAALTEDDRLLILDAGEWFERSSFSVPGELVRRESSAAILPVLPRERNEVPWFVDIYAEEPVAGLEDFAEFLGEQELVQTGRLPMADRISLREIGELSFGDALMEWKLFADRLQFRRKGSSDWCEVKSTGAYGAWQKIALQMEDGASGPFLVTDSGAINDLAELLTWFTVQDCSAALVDSVQSAFMQNWLPQAGAGARLWPADLIAVEKIGTSLVALRKDGRLQKLGGSFDFATNQELPKIRQILPIYLYDEFKLTDQD